MKRIAVIAAAVVALACGRAIAQTGTLLSPDQVPDGVQSATAQYVANQGYAFAGDCQQTTADDAQDACSLTYDQGDGSWLVQFSVVNGDGTPNLPPYDQLVVTPDSAAAALAAPPPPAITAPAAPDMPAAPAGPQIVAPLQVTASLAAEICRGRMVGISATVTDGNGVPVAGASVSGAFQSNSGGRGFPFPLTDATGSTSASVDTGRLRGGYNVLWTVTASAGGQTASATASCYAP
jgi:hypothetical protein